MKTLLLPAVAALVCVSVAFAKPEPPPSLLDGSPPVSGWVLKKLSPELRERVEAVQTKAMEEPGIREQREKVDHAARELRDRVRDSMFEIDPGLREAIKAEMPKANFGKETKELPKGVAGMTRSERKETDGQTEIRHRRPRRHIGPRGHGAGVDSGRAEGRQRDLPRRDGSGHGPVANQSSRFAFSTKVRNSAR